MKLLIIGNRSGTNVGGCFERAGEAAGLATWLVETQLAMEAPTALRHISWHLCGRRPPKLDSFSAAVVDICQHWHPDLLLSTGAAPLSKGCLEQLGASGVCTLNYLTDDPWNPVHRAPWFLSALRSYTVVMTPRHSVTNDLHSLGCKNISYMPFAYDPTLHYPDPQPLGQQLYHSGDDVVFVGAGDRDRVPYIEALPRAGIRVGLYGSFWERFTATRTLSRGQIDVPTLRRVTSAAKVALCLVRRANRDGHVMRSFEIAAIGACMLVEDSAEHRVIFGSEGENVAYFTTPAQMVTQLQRLLAAPAERLRLAQAAHQHITGGGNTYYDRLQQILTLVRALNVR